jgi:hypothetical protein
MKVEELIGSKVWIKIALPPVHTRIYGFRSAESRGFGSDPYIPQKRISDNLPVLTPPARGTYR